MPIVAASAAFPERPTLTIDAKSASENGASLYASSAGPWYSPSRGLSSPSPPPAAHDAAFAAHASLVDLFRENVYLALQRQGVEFDAFWWLHARTAADVGPLERLVCPLLRPPAAAGASYECVVRARDAGDPLLRVDVERPVLPLHVPHLPHPYAVLP